MKINLNEKICRSCELCGEYVIIVHVWLSIFLCSGTSKTYKKGYGWQGGLTGEKQINN